MLGVSRRQNGRLKHKKFTRNKSTVKVLLANRKIQAYSKGIFNGAFISATTFLQKHSFNRLICSDTLISSSHIYRFMNHLWCSGNL